MKHPRIAFVVSHPIQYHAPFFRKFAEGKNIDIMVYYLWKFGVEATHDPEFGEKVKWDIPVLEGYPYKFLKNISLRPSSAHPLGEINPGIVREIWKHRYDAVVIYGWNFVTSWLAFSACILSRTPFFIRGESPISQEIKKSNRKLWVKKRILSWLFRRASALLYIGQENKDFYKFYGVPEEKLFFVPYAADNDRFMGIAGELPGKKKELKKRLGVPEDALVILTAGKLIEKKRPMDLLRAFEILVKSERKTAELFSLVYVGDGHLRGDIEEYAEAHGLQNVIITGFKNQTELPACYAAADVFVLPSQEGETWGLVVNEAMCFSLPIVVSSVVGSAPDLAREGKNGYVFRMGNVEELAARLADLARDASLRERFGRESKEIVEKYSFTTGVNGIKKALQALDQKQV